MSPASPSDTLPQLVCCGPCCRTPTVGICHLEAKSDPRCASDFKSLGPGSEALYHPHLGPMMPRPCLSLSFSASDTKAPSTGP